MFLPWSVCHDQRQYRCVFSWTGSGLKIGSAGVGTGVGWVVGVRRGWDTTTTLVRRGLDTLLKSGTD